ncbi:MAG: hypothetical protein IRZ16_19430 [Myxococcaceae bacterium]|nr:hypothetical protein [Myxococcaceae bacterium]
MERLGRLGDRRALEEIRAARKKDDEQTPWYRFTCLGRLAIDAEEQILARN